MRHLEGGNGSQTAHRIRKLMQNENAQHGDVQWVQPAETKQCKTPDAESFDKTLLVVRRDDEPAQHEKEVDKQITVPQQRDIGKVAVGLSSEMSSTLNRFPSFMRRHAAFIYGFQPRSQYFRLLLVDDMVPFQGDVRFVEVIGNRSGAADRGADNIGNLFAMLIHRDL